MRPLGMLPQPDVSSLSPSSMLYWMRCAYLLHQTRAIVRMGSQCHGTCNILICRGSDSDEICDYSFSMPSMQCCFKD